MKAIIYYKIYLLAIMVLFSISCENTVSGSEPDLTDTLDPVEDVLLIPGGENATILVNKNHQTAYFSLLLSDISPNDFIENGTKEAWCIDWTKPIQSSNSTYNGIKLYSTDMVEKWKPVNYLLNISQDLRSSDPDITWRELQIAIWSLRANPEFDLDTISTEDLPSSFRTENGERNFNIEKVNEILSIVESGYEDFDFSSGTKFAVIAETPVDVQTVFVVVEK
ncbi:hypothetical protein [Rhodohalobacter barkolensis]|uniref:Uncharacterized protein n=1 Tax=Rhodohalobacter barkolensis TaxID=2053187 RepID=A0A2N0VJJ9_9BACT|nr:hypothetical protein [Rhodohalobacter barkolensis]PKD44334.1 hypothetical protein CWD77_02370 [Rhodohalobacter barkolensis]